MDRGSGIQEGGNGHMLDVELRGCGLRFAWTLRSSPFCGCAPCFGTSPLNEGFRKVQAGRAGAIWIGCYLFPSRIPVTFEENPFLP